MSHIWSKAAAVVGISCTLGMVVAGPAAAAVPLQPEITSVAEDGAGGSGSAQAVPKLLNCLVTGSAMFMDPAQGGLPHFCWQ